MLTLLIKGLSRSGERLKQPGRLRLFVTPVFQVLYGARLHTIIYKVGDVAIEYL